MKRAHEDDGAEASKDLEHALPPSESESESEHWSGLPGHGEPLDFFNAASDSTATGLLTASDDRDSEASGPAELGAGNGAKATRRRSWCPSEDNALYQVRGQAISGRP